MIRDNNKAESNATNQLIRKLLDYSNTEGYSLDEMASKLSMSPTYLKALVHGGRDIRQLPVDNIRRMSFILGMSCFSALLLAECIGLSDLTGQEVVSIDMKKGI